MAEWIGRRFYFGHAHLFADDARYHSLISSRIGRHGCELPGWPRWVDGTLRHVQRHRGRLLVTSGSTLAESVQQFAAVARLPVTQVTWTESGDPASWLLAWLKRIDCDAAHRTLMPDALHLSPMLEPATREWAEFPIQDRLSVALADHVWSLALRTGGNLQALLGRRLEDRLFPPGSVFVTLSTENVSLPTTKRRFSATKHTVGHSFLARGAVGWLLNAEPYRSQGPLRHCASEAAPEPTSQQLVSPLPAAWTKLSAAATWPYLVHCTRGGSGPLLEESEDSFRQRAWSEGQVRVWHPLETLAQICRHGCLRATAEMTRTRQCCVSFSAVPLAPLLRRRQFRGHLNRWDWEPYGLLVRHASLVHCSGGRQVIYGSELDFQNLREDDKPFFQPRWQKRRREDWSAEREWRVLGDVDLKSLPLDSVLLFVRTQLEAQQLSRHAAWPVFWLE